MLSSLFSDGTAFARRKQVLCSAENTGSGLIANSGSFVIPMPDGYTSAGYLFYTIRTTGLLTATIVSPVHATSTILVYGQNAQAGSLSTTEQITSITLANNSGAAVWFEYSCFALPDISLEASFRGLQSTGARTSIT